MDGWVYLLVGSLVDVGCVHLLDRLIGARVGGSLSWRVGCSLAASGWVHLVDGLVLLLDEFVDCCCCVG